MKTSNKKKLKKILIGVALSVGFIILSAVSALLLLLSHTPALYQPVIPEDPDQVSTYLTHTLAPQFHQDIQLENPFTLTIEQAGLNDILSRLRLPSLDGATLLAPAAAITENGLYLMATIKKGKYSAVVTISFQPSIDRTGRLRLNLQSVKLGALPATSLTRKLAAGMTQSLRGMYSKTPILQNLPAALLENQPVEPVFTFDRRMVRLTDLNLRPGLLCLTFSPTQK